MSLSDDTDYVFPRHRLRTNLTNPSRQPLVLGVSFLSFLSFRKTQRMKADPTVK